VKATISEILQLHFSKERVTIIIPKSIIEVGESNLHHALVGRFIGVRTLIDLIRN